MSRMLMKTMLKELRKNGYTDTAIAEMVGVSQTCISSIRRGKSNPTQKTKDAFWDEAERHQWKERFANSKVEVASLSLGAAEGDPGPAAEQSELFDKGGKVCDLMDVETVKRVIAQYDYEITGIIIETRKGNRFRILAATR